MTLLAKMGYGLSDNHLLLEEGFRNLADAGVQCARTQSFVGGGRDGFVLVPARSAKISVGSCPKTRMLKGTPKVHFAHRGSVVAVFPQVGSKGRYFRVEDRVVAPGATAMRVPSCEHRYSAGCAKRHLTISRAQVCTLVDQAI